jgi:ubiquinone/menaquinone biosynthesis C-methylase UbiE
MIGRDVYRSGGYVRHFQPDDARNPFRALYEAKRRDVVSSVTSSLTRGGSVLDLGGGLGRIAVPLASTYEVTMCDVSADMLDIAGGAGRSAGIPSGNLRLHRLDANEPLPFPSRRFDRAICTDVLVHLVDPGKTLRELRRVLKPDGELLVDVSNRSPWWIPRYPRTLGRRPSRWLSTWRSGGVSPEWQATVRHYSRTEYLRMLAGAGLEVAQEWRYGPWWCATWFLARCRPAGV